MSVRQNVGMQFLATRAQRRGHPEKPVRDPEKEKREKTNTTGWREGKNMGLRDVIVLENNYETREPLHERRRWVEVDSD